MNRAELVELQAEKLTVLLNAVTANNAFYQAKLAAASVDVPRLTRGGQSVNQILDGVPFTTRDELQEDQRQHPPYGTNLTAPRDHYSRYHQTSGSTGAPLRWLDTPASWNWFLDCWQDIYRAAGVTPADRVLFPFSFGPFIGFWAAFEGASRYGCLVVSGGGLSSVGRLQLLVDHKITVVACTPTYALRLAEVAREEGIDLPGTAVRALIVAGEPGGSVPATRARIESAWGARCFDHCGMTEVGSFGVECVENPGGMHVLESEVIVEVIGPETGTRQTPPARGELVVTNLGRVGSPVLRYRTGDAVHWTETACPCGRPFGRLEGGILARIDDMVFVRGNNVYPAAIEDVLRSFDEIAEFRIRVRRSTSLAAIELEVEPTPNADETRLAKRVSKAVQSRLFFRPDVLIMPAGTLPRFELKGKRLVKEDLED